MDRKKSYHDPAHIPTPEPASDGLTSFVGRIRTSATGLARESLLRPNPGTAVNQLASADAGKSGPSSSSVGPSAAAMSLQGPVTGHPSFSGTGFSDSDYRSFRSQPLSETTRAVTDDFNSFLSLQGRPQSNLGQLGDCPQFAPSLQYAGSDTSSSEKGAVTPPDLGRPFNSSEYQIPNGHPADGAAVVAMLSDPSLCIDDIPDLTAGLKDLEDDYQSGATAAGSFAQRSVSDIEPTADPLSLIPDFDDPSNKPCVSSLNGDSRTASEGKQQVEADVPESRRDERFEVQPWIEMLSTYHDEVWGDMLPLVRQAREEASAIQNGDAGHCEDFPAIRRLAMIAGHVKPKATG
ncbi:MAG: hypothetical protein Q9169_004549 [Polycauliona sp. 2 TL-2023]